jgi:two-component system, OmpR family, response regulator RegX3
MAAAAATAVRTLIVEDDQDSADALARALAEHGHDVNVVGNVGKALVRLEMGLPPQVIILDLRLPDASGGLLLRRVRRDRLDIKVAVVTGVADAESNLDLKRFPPDALFRKPVRFHELLGWLESVT